MNDEIRKCLGRIRSAVALGHDPETFLRELERLLEPPRGYVLTPERVRDALALERDLAASERVCMPMYRLDFTNGTVTKIDARLPPRGWAA